MDRGIEPTRETSQAKVPPPPHRKAPAADLDLDRLVWDPEYRNAMRHLIGRGD